ncbi:MAG: hypothetical protein ABSF35_17695 [Polyangia bacterium]|jgi:hypothetical protein
MPKNQMHSTPEPKAKPLDPPQLNTKALIDVRGWTKTGIKKFLNAPYRIERCHSDNVGDYVVYWYLTTSVVAAEATPAFKAFQEKKAARSEAARKGVSARYKKTMDFVHKLDIQVPQLDRETLVRRACDFYNARANERGPGPASASIDSDPAFLACIMVDYIRQNLTDYEAALHAQFGKVGVADAVDAIRSKVYAAIAEAYPDLAEECRRMRAGLDVWTRCGRSNSPAQSAGRPTPRVD